ncbi:YheC/YheD family protein [Metabacillus litoralis]|uniref:YheC/YheD family endospore coat-associated protein n=1 Tax=Metabacillus litoralis TaxID=152268 RepID=UPI00203CB8E1|nr:YheC/YheD family protein [Metabacillus litoralis]MCM3655472.1 YheC/YheD family protein [Metabacillus litoralis]
MFSIIQDMGSSHCVKLNPKYKYLIKGSKSLNVVYGIRSATVTIFFSDSISENQLSISDNVLKLLFIPTTSSYAIRFHDGDMMIGPFIGILASVTNAQLLELIPSLNSYVKYYDKIGGTLIAFSLEGINQKKQTIKGLIYLPWEKEWKIGSFPFPNSVFSIVETSLSENWITFQQNMKQFHEILGKRIFNFPNFDKWTMFQMLKKSMHENLPNTQLYIKPLDVKKMLKRHQSIYIKPINGRLGKYVCKLSLTSDGIFVHFGRRRKRIKTFKTWRKLSKFLTYKLQSGQYLIQQSIDLFTYDHRIIDFRMMMVKNEIGKWENIGIIARYGSSNSIVSNITAGGKAELGVKTLQSAFHLSSREIKSLFVNMNAMALRALSIVEANGYHCGNIGFDVGIDKSGKIWIIEMNNQNPDHYIAVKANKKELLYQAKLKNILYAKKLAMEKTKDNS